jgi:hypothetical protein
MATLSEMSVLFERLYYCPERNYRPPVFESGKLKKEGIRSLISALTNRIN